MKLPEFKYQKFNRKIIYLCFTKKRMKEKFYEMKSNLRKDVQFNLLSMSNKKIIFLSFFLVFFCTVVAFNGSIIFLNFIEGVNVRAYFKGPGVVL